MKGGNRSNSTIDRQKNMYPVTLVYHITFLMIEIKNINRCGLQIYIRVYTYLDVRYMITKYIYGVFLISIPYRFVFYFS